MIIAITPADEGTWLDGAQGWHNTYRVVERAQSYGFTLNDRDTRIMERYRDGDSTEDSDTAEYAAEIATEATEYLQSLAPTGWVFLWDAGELSLTQDTEPEE